MTAEELQQIKRQVLEELPKVLQQDPGFIVFLERVLSERFPRREEFAHLLDELRALRVTMKDRFEQVDEHFVQVDRRFDQVDERFEQVDRRFEQMDERFEHVDRRFEQVDERFKRVINEIRGLRDWMEINVGGLQRRAGRRLEDVVAGAFCYGLERQDILPEHVQLRRKLTDVEGFVFRAGKQREMDIITTGSEIIVFEVKSNADEDDIEDLADKVRLVKHLHPDQSVEGVLVMLGAETDHRTLCQQHGLRLIP